MFKKVYKFNFLVFFLFFLLNVSVVFSVDDNLFKSNIFFDRAKQVLDEVCQIQSSYVPEVLDETIQFDQVINLDSKDSDKEEDFIELPQELNEEEDTIDDISNKNLDSESKLLPKDPITQDFNRTYLYKQIKFVLSKLSFYRFTSNDVSSYRLEVLLKEIDELESDFLNTDKSFLLQESIKKLSVVFDLLRKGISCELSFDHLMIFRENLILHMQKILKLKDYWTMELHNNSFIDRVKNSFQYFGEEELKLKIKKLNFIKDRVASYIGKADELFLYFFQESSLFAESGEGSLYEASQKLNKFVDESIFCINSFFSQKFDPDKNSYTKMIEDLRSGSFIEFVKLLCQNHVNVQLIEGTCKHQIKDFRVASFLRRHWLMLSVLGTGTAAGGTYLYLNWDWLMGPEEDSPKNRIINMGTDARDGIFESFTNFKEMAKNKFWPDANKKDEDDPKSLRYLFKDYLGRIANNTDAFSDALKNKCIELKERGVDLPFEIDDLDKIDMGDFLKALEKFKNGPMKEGHNAVADGAQDIVDKGALLNNLIREMFSYLDLGGAPTGFSMDPTLPVRGGNHYLERLRVFVAALQSVRPEFEGEGPANQSLSGESISALTGLLDKVWAFINTFPTQIKNGGNIGEIYEIIVYKLIVDVLKLAYIGVDGVVEKVDESTRLARVTLNWIKALVPVLITTIIVPTVSILIVKKIMNNREKTRYNIVNNIVSEIYRILNCYNSMSFDSYHKELRYKDQGMLGFWIEILNGKTNTVSREDKIRLLKVISDMQNPDLSVSQKIEFIKLEWGKHLFANSAVV